MPTPIKVLHVLESVEGGVVRHVSDLVKYGDGATHAVALPRERHGYFTDHAAVAAIGAAAAQTRFVDMRRSITSWRNPAAVAKIARFASAWSPDVIHGHSSIGGVAARLIGAARPTSAVVWTPHAIAPQRAALAIERALSRITDRVVAVSSSEASLLTTLSIASGEQLVVIPNGIELDPVIADPPSLHELCGAPPEAPLVGCVARLSEQKGIDTLIQAARLVFERHPSVWFVMIGAGDLAPLVRDAAASMPRFAWIDGLPQARGVLDQLSMFVLLSRYEGLPYALMEAMAAGLPCVVTDVVGNQELVADGETGVLVPAEDAEAAADGVLRLLADDAARGTLGSAARSYAARFDVAVMAQQTVAMYRDAIAKRR